MAKGNPNSVAVQYKVHLKPTEVGALVMRRMERPHLDKSAELRRFIELGYAAEQAGFILDGTILRHGGRTWDTQPDLNAYGKNLASTASDDPAPAKQRTRVGASSKRDLELTASGAAQGSVSVEDQKADGAPAAGSSLRANLRGISG
jgi:hypothetical protein